MSKEGIGYFSFDTDFFHTDKKVKLIKSEFGSKGVVILIYALCAIYSDKGYYAEWGEDDCYLWSEDLGCDCSPNLIGEVINRCVKRGIFDEDVFNAFGVLTSHGIQIRFLKAAAKREKIKIIQEYALFSLDELKEGMRNKVTFFSDKVDSSTQKVARLGEKVASSDIKKESKESKDLICAPEPHDPEKPLEPEPDPEEILEKNFKIIYDIYPKKVGRTVAFANYKQWVSPKGRNIGGKRYRLTNKQIYLAVRRYVRKQEESGQDDLQYWKNFDTLMGRQLLDYVEWEGNEK